MGKPWEQQRGEGASAYQAFLTYRDLGSERTLMRVCDTVHAARRGARRSKAWVSGGISGWSARWHWVERVRAWDVHLQSLRDQAVTRGVTGDEETRLRFRKKRLHVAGELLDRALELLAHPTTRKSVSEDGQSVTVRPAGWVQRDIAVIAKVACDLADSALSSDPSEGERPRPRIVLPGHWFDGDLADSALAPEGIEDSKARPRPTRPGVSRNGDPDHG